MRIFQALHKVKCLVPFWVLLAASSFSQSKPQRLQESRLAASAKAPIRVAFVVTEGAVMIDFAGPWEVFQDVMLVPKGHTKHEPGMGKHGFELYTVSDSTHPIHASGGMQIIPDYTFDNAPTPNIVVIPAQDGNSPKMMDWIRKMYRTSDVTMSVCTGAFTLAQTGLLNGKKATTHHDTWAMLHNQFPKIEVLSNKRWVQNDPVLFTSGGLSSGIDLALHIVDLYFGRSVAEDTADTMEYEGRDWKGTGASSVTYTDAMAAMKMDQ